jgi:hypothetical protein
MLAMPTSPTPRRLRVPLACSLLLAPAALLAQPASSPQEQIDALRRQLEEQSQVLDSLRKALGEQDARVRELQRALETQQRTGGADAARSAQQAPAPSTPPAEPARTVQIGTAPAAVPESPLSVPQLFDQPSVLTARGMTIVEPSLQYGYSSAHRAALVGFTVIPAILIGLIDVREVRRNTTVATLTIRHGFTERFELEGRLPWVYRSDSTVSREIFTASATERSFSAQGSGIGDIEATARYQLTTGSGRWPFLIGSLRFKSRTGKDLFEVTTDCVTRCVANATGTGEPLRLPTGTGFYTLQPGITWLYPTDPAVFFGSFTYAYNFKRSNVSRRVLGGEVEFLGDVKPGNVFGFNVGMGLSVNDRSSFSIGVEVSTIGRLRQNGEEVPGSVRTQLASMLLGYSFRWDQNRTIHVSVAAGLTRDTPDVTLTLRVPFAF